MISITLRQMAYFDALAHTRHFGRAAERAHVSQPALSVQIAEMEARLGAKLFERDRSGVELTGLGERIWPRIRRILAEEAAIADMAAAGDTPLSGRLRLGVIPTIAPYLLPRLIPLLRDTYPLLAMELKEATTDACLDSIAAREIDAAIVALPVNADGIASRPLFSDRFLMAMAEADDTLLAGPVTAEMMPADRLLLLAEGHCLRDQALEVCGLKPRRMVNYEATSMATLVQMVSAGMGMTLIPEMAAPFENRAGGLRLLSFAEPQPFRRIGLVHREGSEREADFAALAACVIGSRIEPRGQDAPSATDGW